MKVTFLIGNGFDINCGLKCKYKNVYDTYIKTPSASPIIESFKKEIDGNYDAWSDFEVGMANYMCHFKNETDFLTCIRDFKRHLNEHLESECNLFKDRVQLSKSITDSVYGELLESINSFFEGVNHDISRRFKRIVDNPNTSFVFINFNYTTALETVSQYSNRAKIIYIHGQINDDMVLGMDNENQIGELQFPLSRRIRRAFIKPFFNNEYDSQRVHDAEDSIKNSDVICVYGMSLGISDLTWKTKLIDWLETNETGHLFVYRYRDSMQSFFTKDEQLDHEEASKEQLLQDLNVEKANWDKYFSRIHIPCGRNIFNFGQVINDATAAYNDKERQINEGRKRVKQMMDQNEPLKPN